MFRALALRGAARSVPLRSALNFAPPKVEAVLDVGCGTGELLGELVRRWPTARVVGLDFSEAMLARAARRRFSAAVELFEGSVYELPFG